MKKNIQDLYRIANSSSRKIIGLMSGTSFDGLDIALCGFEGAGTETRLKLLQFETKVYSPGFKEEIKAVFSKKMADLEAVTLLNGYVGNYFGELVLESLRSWSVEPAAIDLIASHGQTIFHAPKWSHHRAAYGNATLQIGDGDHLAVKTGIITLSDFRQKHIAGGGEGAPLAMYGDYLLFGSDDETRIMLNIGGIANFTFLPAGKEAEKVFSTDVGPGNTLIDQFVQSRCPGLYYDADARMAMRGSVSQPLLDALLDHSFFLAAFPKTTGPELFNLEYLKQAIRQTGLDDIRDADVLATLTMFSAESIIRAITQTVGTGSFRIYLSGGGMHNPLLIRNLENFFGKNLFASTAALGVDPDAKEAVLFALLANEAVAGKGIKYGNNERRPQISMGKLSFPD